MDRMRRKVLSGPWGVESPNVRKNGPKTPIGDLWPDGSFIGAYREEVSCFAFPQLFVLIWWDNQFSRR